VQRSEKSGKVTVGLQVGPSGNVCSASIAEDTLGIPEVSSCVLSNFRGKSFPAPDGGCAVVNVPIQFSVAK
jgi:hypothetical protein